MEVFVGKVNKILDDFATFPRLKVISLTDDKKEHSVKTVCYLCGEKIDQGKINFIIVSDYRRYREKHQCNHLIYNIT